MSKMLKLAADLSLPLTAVTETFGVLAARGAGKSNLAAVLAEQMFDAGLPFVVVDPVGSWYGLRAGADGQKDGGLPIPIFGGKHGDVPLERGGGELLADLVVSKRLSCVLDLSAFDSEAAKKQFLLAFAQRLYLKNTDPLHLFLEEADDYIPQRPMRDEAQLLRAWENIVRRGRARGLGMTLITQRSASINKSVLTQVQTLFVLRTTGPQDRAAIEAWVKYHDTDAKVLSSLSSLGPGEGWVWSPQFLGQMSKHQFHRRRTFDSGATPKNLRGKDVKAAATLADVDLPEIHAQMAATIERAKADDPKELKKQLAAAQAEITNLRKSSNRNEKPALEKPKDVPVLTDADRELLKSLRDEFLTFSESIADKADAMLAGLADRAKATIDTALTAWTSEVEKRRALWIQHLDKTRIQRVLEKLERVPAPDYASKVPNYAGTGRIMPVSGPIIQSRESLQNRPKIARSENNPSKTGGSFRNLDSGQGDASVGNSGLRRMLMALAQRPQGLNRRQLGLRAGLSSRSGTFDTYLSRGRQAGWIDGRSDLRITDAGITALGAFTPLPEGRELLAHWLGELGESGAARILRALADAYPRALTRSELGAAANLSDRSGTFDTYLSRLRTLELVEGRGELRASEELFS